MNRYLEELDIFKRIFDSELVWIRVLTPEGIKFYNEFSEISEGKVTAVQLKVTPYERNPYARSYVVINFDRRTVGTPSRSLLSNEQIKQLRDLGCKINRVMKFS